MELNEWELIGVNMQMDVTSLFVFDAKLKQRDASVHSVESVGNFFPSVKFFGGQCCKSSISDSSPPFYHPSSPHA